MPGIAMYTLRNVGHSHDSAVVVDEGVVADGLEELALLGLFDFGGLGLLIDYEDIGALLEVLTNVVGEVLQLVGPRLQPHSYL